MVSVGKFKVHRLCRIVGLLRLGSKDSSSDEA